MKIIQTIISLLFFISVSGQTFDPVLSSKLSLKLDSLQTNLNIKGISASVIIPNQGQWIGTAGESYAGNPIDSSMLFHIASNTKTFTAVSLLKLVGSGQVNLEDSLHQWLPEYNPNINSNITIRQLLNHTSGIANTFDVPGFNDSLSNDWDRIYTPPEILGWLPVPNFLPGTGQSYSNPNYNLVGLIIESATSQPLERVIRDSILIPMDLTNTYFPIYDTLNAVIAHPWQNGMDLITQPRTSLLTANWASGAMYSTAKDMAKWYNQLMNGIFLEQTEYEEMTTFVGPQSRGMGVQEVSISGINAIGHGGGTLGYGSIMIYDPNSGVVIAVLINEGNANQFMVAEELLTLILNSITTNSVDIYHTPIVNVYPNPALDVLTIKIEGTYDKLVANIFDLNGKPILNKINQTSFSINSIQPGIYILKLQIDNKIVVKKIKFLY